MLANYSLIRSKTTAASVCILDSHVQIKLCFCFQAVSVLILLAQACQANEDAKRLLDDLFANYNNMVRPVANPSDIIKLHLGIKLSQIADIVSVTLSFSSKALPIDASDLISV